MRWRRQRLTLPWPRADGVFLINQGCTVDELLPHLRFARARHGSSLWMGVNLLGVSLSEVIALPLQPRVDRIDGIWQDDAGVDRRDAALTRLRRQELLFGRGETGWKGVYFGGVAFKTQPKVAVNDLQRVTATAAEFVDVVTTSGDATGVAADTYRLALMCDAAGSIMALASGVTPDNIDTYLPLADAFLVASGIESDFGVLDPGKTKALADKIHGYDS